MDTINLTPEEEAVLTPFNAVAFDMLRAEYAEKNTCPPCWLCMSTEAREEAREKTRFFLQFKVGPLGMSMEDAEALAQRALGGSEVVSRWREAELAFKRMRAEGNPRAWFAE